MRTDCSNSRFSRRLDVIAYETGCGETSEHVEAYVTDIIDQTDSYSIRIRLENLIRFSYTVRPADSDVAPSVVATT